MKVFISHKHKDKGFAKSLATNLREYGIYSWYDEWNLEPGKPLTDAMEEAILGCQDFLFIISKESVKSIRENNGALPFELHIAQSIQFENPSFRIIGILKEKCKPPHRLKNRIGRWIDFSSKKNNDESIIKLVKFINKEEQGPIVKKKYS